MHYSPKKIKLELLFDPLATGLFFSWYKYHRAQGAYERRAASWPTCWYFRNIKIDFRLHFLHNNEAEFA